MRDKILGVLTVSIFSTALLAVPAFADLAVKAGDPTQATTRSDDDDSGAQVDSFFSDIGNAFSTAAKKTVSGLAEAGDALHQGGHAARPYVDGTFLNKYTNRLRSEGQEEANVDTPPPPEQSHREAR